MTQAANKQVLQQFLDATNQGDLSAIEALVSPEFVDHNLFPGQEPGREGLKGLYRTLQTAIPDYQFTPLFVIAEGDRVASRGTHHGTYSADLLGWPATGRPVSWTSTRIFRVEDGKLVEGWIDSDHAGLLQQLSGQAG